MEGEVRGGRWSAGGQRWLKEWGRSEAADEEEGQVRGV